MRFEDMTREQAAKELEIDYLGDSMRMREAKKIAVESIDKVRRITAIVGFWNRSNDDAEKIIEKILEVL